MLEYVMVKLTRDEAIETVVRRSSTINSFCQVIAFRGESRNLLRDFLCVEVADKLVMALIPYRIRFKLGVPCLPITLHSKEVASLLLHTHGGHSSFILYA